MFCYQIICGGGGGCGVSFVYGLKVIVSPEIKTRYLASSARAFLYDFGLYTSPDRHYILIDLFIFLTFSDVTAGFSSGFRDGERDIFCARFRAGFETDGTIKIASVRYCRV